MKMSTKTNSTHSKNIYICSVTVSKGVCKGRQILETENENEMVAADSEFLDDKPSICFLLGDFNSGLNLFRDDTNS